MAPKHLKRPAGVAASPPPFKKPAAEDPIVSKCEAVRGALARAEAYPEGVRTMLQATAALALGTIKAERHDFQVKVVGMIEAALKSIEEKARSEVDALQGKVDRLEEDERAPRQAALAGAEQALTELKEATIKSKASLEAERAAEAAAKKELAATQKLQMQGDEKLVSADQKKSRLEAVRDGALAATKIEPAATAELKALASLGKEFCFDPSLMQALPLVLKKDPGARSAFDLAALGQLDAEFAQALAEQTAILDSGAAGKADRAGAVAAADTAYKQAIERHAAAKDTHAVATAAEADGKAALVAAKEEVANFIPYTKALMDAYDSKKAQLSQLCKGPLLAFQELCEREAPPPVEPEQKAAAEPAAAEGPGGAADAEAAAQAAEA